MVLQGQEVGVSVEELDVLRPAPLGEGSRNGSLTFDLGHIPKGQRYELYIQFQVNPTNVGHRSADVDLYDGNTKLLTVHRNVTVFP